MGLGLVEACYSSVVVGELNFVWRKLRCGPMMFWEKVSEEGDPGGDVESKV